MTTYENEDAISEIIKNLNKIPKEVTTQQIPEEMSEKIAQQILKELKRKIAI